MHGSRPSAGACLIAAYLVAAYLIALVVTHGGCFVTFDGAVAVAAVPGAQKKHLRVI